MYVGVGEIECKISAKNVPEICKHEFSIHVFTHSTNAVMMCACTRSGAIPWIQQPHRPRVGNVVDTTTPWTQGG